MTWLTQITQMTQPGFNPDVMYIQIHDVGLSVTVLAENNRITLSKASAT